MLSIRFNQRQTDTHVTPTLDRLAGKHGQAAMPHLTGNSPRAGMFMPRDKAAPKAVSNHVPKFGERQHWGLTSN